MQNSLKQNKVLNKWASSLYLRKHSVPKGSWCSRWELCYLKFIKVLEMFYSASVTGMCLCATFFSCDAFWLSQTACFLSWKLNSFHHFCHCLHLSVHMIHSWNCNPFASFLRDGIYLHANRLAEQLTEFYVCSKYTNLSQAYDLTSVIFLEHLKVCSTQFGLQPHVRLCTWTL